jgi:hypothetical protein
VRQRTEAAAKGVADFNVLDSKRNGHRLNIHLVKWILQVKLTLMRKFDTARKIDVACINDVDVLNGQYWKIDIHAEWVLHVRIELKIELNKTRNMDIVV